MKKVHSDDSIRRLIVFVKPRLGTIGIISGVIACAIHFVGREYPLSKYRFIWILKVHRCLEIQKVLSTFAAKYVIDVKYSL
jgi:hypothetical protein